jgi:hypothetical protein
MTGTRTTDFAHLSTELNALIVDCSVKTRLRITRQAKNYALKMEADAKNIWYDASGLKVRSGLLHGSYGYLFEEATDGDSIYTKVGVQSKEAMSRGVNYAVVQEWGTNGRAVGSYHKTGPKMDASGEYITDKWGDIITGHTASGYAHNLRARLVATNAVKTQGQIFLNRLLREVGF